MRPGAAEAQNPSQVERLCSATAGKAPLLVASPSAKGDPLVGSVEACSTVNPGMSPMGGVAVMAMRSRSPAVEWRCKSPLKPQHPPQLVGCAMPTTPNSKQRYVQVAPTQGPFPGAVAAFRYQ